jgi:predicted nucleic acid-binding protein
MRDSGETFVDTSAWVALLDKDDAHHKKAASLMPSLLKTQRSLVTSSFIITETYVIILKEIGHKNAGDFLQKLKGSARVLRVLSSEEIESEAEQLLEKYADQDFSYTDAVSLVIMKRRKIRNAFCLDKHFSTAGYVVVP